ncbi:MAG: AzlD domain-containing protein [Amphritea sp.]
MDTPTLWGVFLAVGLGTFLIRLSFVQLHGSMQSVLERCQSILILLPPAILAALCIPSILFEKSATDYVPDLPQVLAAVVTMLLAKFSRSVFWPIVGGMGALWFSRWLMG